MGIDTIKVIYTYSIATLVILAGFGILYFSRLDPPESQSAALSLVMAGFIGAAIQFVFNRETQTSTARQVERATAAGASTQPTVTTNNATSTTVEPTSAGPDA